MKKLLLTTVLTVVTMMAMANPIGRTAAMQKAKDFMRGINPQALLQTPATPRRAMGDQAQKPYYIFNAENNQGFVIVSGDDRSEEILGFSDKGHLDVDNLPDGLLYMLDTFEEDLQKLDEQGYTNTVDAQASSNSRRKSISVPREPIAPLIKTYWTQSSPFVDMMEEEVVGCQRIASSQLLFYWGCDKTLATITGVPTSIQASGKYEPQTFDMTKIRAHYRNGSGTDEERAEVARYISCVRYSLGTGTQSDMVNPKKGPRFWGITPGAILHRQNCFPDDFERIVYEELKNNAPVFVGGHCKSATPNHYFLVDGYSHDDFFHINWGWAGVCDGYFRLSPLNAYNWSTVANWSQTFEALIGFRGPGLVAESTAQPNDEASLGLITFSFANSSNSIVYDDQTISRTGTLKIRTYLENWSNNFNSSESRTFDLEIAAYDMDNNKVKTLATQQVTLAQAARKAVIWNLKNIDLPDGDYQLVSKSKDATYSGDYHFDYVKGVYSHAKLTVNGDEIRSSLVKAMTIDNYEFIGKKKPGYRTAIKFYVTNNSFNKLTWNFSLYKNQINDSVGYTQDTEEFRMQAKNSHEFVMEFEADNKPCTLFLYNQDRAARGLAQPIYAEIPFDPSSFSASTATNSNLSFSWNLENSTIDNYGRRSVYGNELKGTVKITNSSRSATYEDIVTIQIYYGRASYNNRYKSANIMVPMKLAPRASVTVDLSGFNYSDGAFDTEKTLYFLVFDGSYQVDEDNDYFTYVSWTVKPSVNYWDKDGKLSYTTSVSTTAPNAAAVSYKGMTVSDNITPNSNPNCIYYFDSEAQAMKLKNYQRYNVVVGNRALTTIKFDETNAAYVPFSFTAANVSYTRKMTNAFSEGSENQKWSTICLPFDVNSVKVGSNSVLIGDDVELRRFYGEEFNSIFFDAAYKMEANRPYLIRVSEENLNKTLTFASTNATVVAGSAMLDANNYDFTGNYTTTRDENGKYVYTIDNNGDNFVYTASPTYKTFYAYMTSEVKLSNTLFINDRAPKKAVKSDHRFPAVEFTYNGSTYVVPAWDEVAVNGTVRTRLQALSKIQTGQTSVPARTVTSCAQSVDDESVFEPFEDGTGNITIDNVSKSVSTLTYGEVCDQLNILIATEDRDVKVFDFTPATATSLTVPTLWENNGRTFIMNEIGAGTYYGNSTLTEVTIPVGITTIKDAAFAGCTMLNKVTFESEEPVAVEGDPFAGMTKNKCAVYVPSNIVKAYRESNSLWDEFIFAVPVSATKKFVSFCSDVPFTTRQFNGTKWVAPSSIWMYWVNKAKNNDPTSLTLTSTRDLETKTIPAGFGLVMKTSSTGGSGYIFMPPVGAVEKSDLIADNNMMKGVLVKTQMSDIVEANPNNNYYILTNNMFQLVTSGNLLPGLAYLEMPKSLFNGQAKATITLEDEVTDGILLVNGDEHNNGSVYDIQGRKVENATKGIYIVNGKKVVIK